MSPAKKQKSDNIVWRVIGSWNMIMVSVCEHVLPLPIISYYSYCEMWAYQFYWEKKTLKQCSRQSNTQQSNHMEIGIDFSFKHFQFKDWSAGQILVCQVQEINTKTFIMTIKQFVICLCVRIKCVTKINFKWDSKCVNNQIDLLLIIVHNSNG